MSDAADADVQVPAGVLVDVGAETRTEIATIGQLIDLTEAKAARRR